MLRLEEITQIDSQLILKIKDVNQELLKDRSAIDDIDIDIKSSDDAIYINELKVIKLIAKSGIKRMNRELKSLQREHDLIKHCLNSKRLKIYEAGWAYKVQKDNSQYEIFNISKHSLTGNGGIELEHENYRVKKRKGQRSPTHAQDFTFQDPHDLVKYLKKHRSQWAETIKGSRKRNKKK